MKQIKPINPHSSITRSNSLTHSHTQYTQDMNVNSNKNYDNNDNNKNNTLMPCTCKKKKKRKSVRSFREYCIKKIKKRRYPKIRIKSLLQKQENGFIQTETPPQQQQQQEQRQQMNNTFNIEKKQPKVTEEEMEDLIAKFQKLSLNDN